MNLGEGPVCIGGPVGARNLLVCGSFWMMRELELSCARVKHLCIDIAARSVEWCLPALKTDVLAVGKVHRWECVCSGAAAMPCP